MERDLCTWKETYKSDPCWTYIIRCTHMIHITASLKETNIYEMRHICMKRDLYTWKSTYKSDPCWTHINRCTHMMNTYQPLHTYDTYHRMKRDLYTWKETKTHGNRRIKATHVAYVWYISPHHLKRPTYTKWDLYAWKETYTHEKRPMPVKRDPFERPMLNTYHPYNYVLHIYVLHISHGYKRDLYTWEETH
jgi:hypothetical protein